MLDKLKQPGHEIDEELLTTLTMKLKDENRYKSKEEMCKLFNDAKMVVRVVEANPDDCGVKAKRINTESLRLKGANTMAYDLQQHFKRVADWFAKSSEDPTRPYPEFYRTHMQTRLQKMQQQEQRD